MYPSLDSTFGLSSKLSQKFDKCSMLMLPKSTSPSVKASSLVEASVTMDTVWRLTL